MVKTKKCCHGHGCRQPAVRCRPALPSPSLTALLIPLLHLDGPDCSSRCKHFCFLSSLLFWKGLPRALFFVPSIPEHSSKWRWPHILLVSLPIFPTTPSSSLQPQRLHGTCCLNPTTVCGRELPPTHTHPSHLDRRCSSFCLGFSPLRC